MFGKSSTKKSAERLIEERLYEQVVIELSDDVKSLGLWAKAIADSDGSEEKAKGLYIKYRVQAIKDELSLAEEARSKKEQKEIRERQRIIEAQRALDKERNITNLKEIVLRIMAFLIAASSFFIEIGLIYSIFVYHLTTKDIMVLILLMVCLGCIAYDLGRYFFFGSTKKANNQM